MQVSVCRDQSKCRVIVELKVANQTVNNGRRTEEEVLAQISIMHYLDIRRLHQRP